jgi:hypothetical protein
MSLRKEPGAWSTTPSEEALPEVAEGGMVERLLLEAEPEGILHLDVVAAGPLLSRSERFRWNWRMVAQARSDGKIAGRPVAGEYIAANWASVIRGATTSRNWWETLLGGMRDSQIWSVSEKLRGCSVGVSIRGALGSWAAFFRTGI